MTNLPSILYSKINYRLVTYVLVSISGSIDLYQGQKPLERREKPARQTMLFNHQSSIYRMTNKKTYIYLSSMNRMIWFYLYSMWPSLVMLNDIWNGLVVLDKDLRMLH